MNMIRSVRRGFAASAVLVASWNVNAANTAKPDAVAALPATPVQAVWMPHEARFTYVGRTTLYSCTGLREKVRNLMKEVGARPKDLKVQVTCADSMYSGFDPIPTVRIAASLPAQATPELLEQIANDPKRKLVARVQGRGDGVDEATAQFPAEPRTVLIEGRRNRYVDEGDCELLEQMVREVFAPMGIREAEGSRLGCLPNQKTLGSVNLRLETLHKQPEPDSQGKN